MERLLALEGALLRGLAEADDLASALPLVVSSHVRVRALRQRMLLERRRSERALCGASRLRAHGARERSALARRRAAARVARGGSRLARGSAGRRRRPPRRVELDARRARRRRAGRRSARSSSRQPRERRPMRVCCTCCAASPCSSVTCTHARPPPSACARASSGSRPRWRWRRSASRTSTTKAGFSTSIRSSARCSATGRASCCARTVKDISHPEDVDTTHELVEPVAAGHDRVVQSREALHPQGRHGRVGRSHRRAETRSRRAQALRRLDRRGHLGAQGGRAVHPVPRQPRRADGIAESHAVLATARCSRARRRAATDAGSPFCSSISIASRSSTTRSVTRPATPCCARRPRACAAACARATSWRGSAATSSSCCCKTSREPSVAARWRPTC